MTLDDVRSNYSSSGSLTDLRTGIAETLSLDRFPRWRVASAAVIVLIGIGAWVGGVGQASQSAPLAEDVLPRVTTTTAAPAQLVVQVAGAVVSPGLYELEEGARVGDALEAAGGFAPNADDERVNLAAYVNDGQRLYVLADGQTEVPEVTGESSDSSDGSGATTVNVNTATEAQLDELPGVGPATASAILEHRKKIGRFESLDQLGDVKGIGPAKLEQIKPLARI